MTHASLFSGIGGFDLAAEWAGWTNVFNCEIDPFCRRVLAYHFPNAIQYEDIKTTDFRPLRGGVDVLTGGFPCQPFSLAGKRNGTADNRYLWPEMLRAIRELAPRWVVGENVFGIVNWSDGLVFEQVCADLEAEDYEVQPYIIPACAVDAPHRRDRVWFVAHRRDDTDILGDVRRERWPNSDGQVEDPTVGGNFQLQPKRPCGIGVVADTNHKRQQQLDDPSVASQALEPCRELSSRGDSTHPARSRGGELQHASCTKGARMRDELPRIERAIPNWERFPTQSPVCGRDDGFSTRLDGITFPRWRRESIKAYGNAVVPQVVLQIFQTINNYESN